MDMTVPYFAELYGVDESIIRRYIRQGRIKAKKLGKIYIIPAGTLYPIKKRPGRKKKNG